MLCRFTIIIITFSLSAYFIIRAVDRTHYTETLYRKREKVTAGIRNRSRNLSIPSSVSSVLAGGRGVGGGGGDRKKEEK